MTRAATEPQVSRRPNRIQGEQTPRRGPAPRDEGVQVATTTPSSRFSQVGEPSVGLSRLSCWRRCATEGDSLAIARAEATPQPPLPLAVRVLDDQGRRRPYQRRDQDDLH